MGDKTGLNVTCHAWAPKAQNRPHETSRVNCIVGSHEYCAQCPNANFVLRIPIRIGDQPVMCPRWENQRDYMKKLKPTEYVPIRRELCLRQRPFEFCIECPNAQPSNEPRNKEGWYEAEQKSK